MVRGSTRSQFAWEGEGSTGASNFSGRRRVGKDSGLEGQVLPCPALRPEVKPQSVELVAEGGFFRLRVALASREGVPVTVEGMEKTPESGELSLGELQGRVPCLPLALRLLEEACGEADGARGLGKPGRPSGPGLAPRGQGEERDLKTPLATRLQTKFRNASSGQRRYSPCQV